MRKLLFLSVILFISVGTVDCQIQNLLSTLLPSLLSNDQLTASILQSPQTFSNLIGLFNYFNNTRNITGVLGALTSDPQLSSLTTTIITVLFESVSYSAMTNNKVSDACQTDMVIFIEELVAGRGWALNMIDAWGKPGTNLASLQTKFVGSYEECIAVDAVSYVTNTDGGVEERGSFKGKYCSAKFAPNFLPANGEGLSGFGYLQLGVCVPDTCMNNDVEILAAMLERALFNSTVPLPPNVRCQEGPNDIGGDVIVAIIILAILGGLVLTGTLYDVLIVQRRRLVPKGKFAKVPVELKPDLHKVEDGPTRSVDNEEVLKGDSNSKTDVQDKSQRAIESGDALAGNKKFGDETNEAQTTRGRLEKILQGFSFYTNGLEILSTKKAGTFGALNGIRFLALGWIILGHTQQFVASYDANLAQFVLEKSNEWEFMSIFFADASVDTFFTISGILVAYLTLNRLGKLGGPSKLNWFTYYFHRFWRLTPTYMLALMIGTVIVPYISSGPLWDFENAPRMAGCRQNWWSNLLYINNYIKVKQDEKCMTWTWYLANDMQFYLISPLLLLPLFYHAVTGMVICVLLLLGSTVAIGVISHTKGFNAQQYTINFLLDGGANKNEDFLKYIYYPGHARIGPYIVGILTGYLLYRWKCKCKIPRALNLAGWFLSICITTLIVYGLYANEDYYTLARSLRIIYGQERDENVRLLSQLESVFYFALRRPAWGLAIAWIVFSCATGNGGWINRLLSWGPFIPFGRLSYCAYLIHPFVITVFFSSRMIPTYFTYYEVIYMFLGHITLTYGLSFIVSLVIETPMKALEKVIFNTGKK